jgi:hypothetical protein
MTTQRKDARYGRWSERGWPIERRGKNLRHDFKRGWWSCHGAAALSEVFWQGF